MAKTEPKIKSRKPAPVPLQTRVNPKIAKAVRRFARKAGCSDATWLRQLVIAEIESETRPISKRNRIPTGIPELDRVLGGGYVQGKLHILGAERGLGKTSLLLQTAVHITANDKIVLLASGEMTKEQSLAYLRRIGGDQAADAIMTRRFDVFADTNGLNITEAVNMAVDWKARILLVDSLQLSYLPDENAEMGSLAQAKSVMEYLRSFAEKKRVAVVAICHLNKHDGFADGETIAHMADIQIRMDRAEIPYKDGVISPTTRVRKIWTEDTDGNVASSDFLLMDILSIFRPLSPALRKLYDTIGEKATQERREREAIEAYRSGVPLAEEFPDKPSVSKEPPEDRGMDGFSVMACPSPPFPIVPRDAKKAPKEAH